MKMLMEEYLVTCPSGLGTFLANVGEKKMWMHARPLGVRGKLQASLASERGPRNGTVQASLGKHVPWAQVGVPEEMTLMTLFALFS